MAVVPNPAMKALGDRIKSGQFSFTPIPVPSQQNSAPKPAAQSPVPVPKYTPSTSGYPTQSILNPAAPQPNPTPVPRPPDTFMHSIAGAGPNQPTNVPKPPVMNAATNNGQVPTPNLGYGGATYGDNAGTNRALEANTTRLKTDPAFKQSEIDRALTVRTNRSAAGLSTADQDKYLASLGYVGNKIDETPSFAPTDTPMPLDAVTNVRSSDELQQSSGDSLAIERAALDNATNTYLASLKNDFDYSNTLLQDNRNLENNAFNRSNSPFTGQTDYRSATLGRGRQIDDNYRASEFNNQSNQARQELYNFDKLAPERQREIYNKLLAAEREFGLNVGELTGVFGAKMGSNGATTGGTPTLAAQGLALQRDQFEYGQTQDQIQNDAQYGGTYNGDPTYGAKIDDRNFDYQVGRDNVGDSQWNKSFDRAKYESDRGYQFQKQQESIKNGQWQQQFNMDVDRLGFQKASEMWNQSFQENEVQQQQSQTKFNQGMAIYEQTGAMPDYMSDYGIDTNGFKDQAIKADLMAMYQALSTQKMTPQQALKQIDDQVAIGAEDKSSGDKLKAAIYKLHPELDPAKKSSNSGNSSTVLKGAADTVGWLTNPAGKLFTNYFGEQINAVGDKVSSLFTGK